MGRVVGAFGMSHIMFPPDGVEAQAETVLLGMLDIRRRVAALRPDRIVLVGGDHFNNFDLAVQVPIALVVADDLQTLGDGGVPVMRFDGDRDFAEGFARFASDRDFDLVQVEEVVPDHGMAFPKLVIDPSAVVQTVLLYVNSAMPVPPSPRRCFALGKALGDYIASGRPEHERTVVIGLGGLSHWLRVPEEGRIATAFDLEFLETLEQGNTASFVDRHSCADIVAAAGNGGLELLSWLVAAGTVDGGGGERLFYEPIVPWITGVGAIELFATSLVREAVADG